MGTVNAINLNEVGTQLIVFCKTWGGECLNWSERQVYVILGNTGLYKTGFWGVVFNIWAKISPAFGALGNFLGTGYGTGILLALLSVRVGFSVWDTGIAFSNIPKIIVFVALVFLTLIALTHGPATII